MSTPFLPRPVRSAEPSAAAPPRSAAPPTQTPPPQQPASAPKPNLNKTRNFGGINLTPSLNLTVVGTNNTPGTGPAGGQQPTGGPTGTPGSDFMSNEDIRAFAEHVRKQARNRAVERAMDAEQLEAVLRHIPAADGSMAGAWMRSRRVSRHLKKIAAAEQLIAKESAAMYAQFEREYEAELRTVSRGRTQQQSRPAFGWR